MAITNIFFLKKSRRTSKKFFFFLIIFAEEMLPSIRLFFAIFGIFFTMLNPTTWYVFRSMECVGEARLSIRIPCEAERECVVWKTWVTLPNERTCVLFTKHSISSGTFIPIVFDPKTEQCDTNVSQFHTTRLLLFTLFFLHGFHFGMVAYDFFLD